jgi:signal transduction histidine kinase
MPTVTRSPWLGYGAVPVAVAAAVLCRLLLWPVVGSELPFLFFWPVIVFAVWYGGLGPGLLATLLSVAATVFLQEPRFSWALVRPADQIGTALFAVLGAVLCFLIAKLQQRILERTAQLTALNERLQRAHHEMEQRVRERTAELATANEALQKEIAVRVQAEEELRRQAEALRKSEEELEERVRERTAELQRSNRDLEQFAYVASHDLQEPLRMVSSYMDLLACRYRGQIDARADKYIHYAVDGASRMQTLINDLLAYSRLGTRARPPEPTDCSAVLKRALADLQKAMEETGAVVTHDPLPTVVADESQLLQVFENLIGNALKFCEGNPPRVHVGVERGEKEWVFSVRDNGIGIASEHHDRIFVLFQRLHARDRYPGTGIGLAICKKVVERHGGRIWVQSQPGQGSTFSFSLPDRREATHDSNGNGQTG